MNIYRKIFLKLRLILFLDLLPNCDQKQQILPSLENSKLPNILLNNSPPPPCSSSASAFSPPSSNSPTFGSRKRSTKIIKISSATEKELDLDEEFGNEMEEEEENEQEEDDEEINKNNLNNGEGRGKRFAKPRYSYNA